MRAAKSMIDMITSSGPRSLYLSIAGPSDTTPTIAIANPSAASSPLKSRGAVPGPNAKPR